MDKITPIGITNYQNKHIPFGIKKKDRGGHIYCIGKTGSGKSTLLLNMAISDILHDEGVCIIDPHGDIAEDILHYIPKKRMNDVIYFNAADIKYPIAFNPLYKVKREDRYMVAATIVTTLKKLWLDSWGPRLEHILRNTLLSLTHYPDSTLLDITPILTNYEFRKKVLYSVDDYSLHEFWQKEFEPLSPQFKNEIIAPILNKVGLFTSHPILKNILGQKKSRLDIAKIMDSKKILIANLSKGVLGEVGSQLLGSMLITQFQTASLQRAKQAIELRKPYYLFIDEMHSFITLSFADILSESRKYGLALFLTHQFTEQVDEDILKAILGNVGTLISFRIGARDAEILKTEFHPIFNEIDLVNLPKHCIYLKLLIDGTASQPFSAQTHPAKYIKQNLRDKIIQISRQKYGVNVKHFQKATRRSQNDYTQKPQSLFDNHNNNSSIYKS